MRLRRTTSAGILALLLCSLPVAGQTAVPAWQEVFRPTASGTSPGSPFAARELADGTILVVTSGFQAIHYDANGGTLSAVHLAAGPSRPGAKGRGPSTPRRNGPDGLPPDGYGKTYAAIDAFGRVAITFVTEEDVQFGSSGKIETAKFDGLTGQSLWAGPAVLQLPGIQYPTAVFLDPAGNVIVTGISRRGSQSQSVTLKYDGQRGSVLWGPMLVATIQTLGTACLDAQGNVYVSVPVATSSSNVDFATLKYSGSNGAVLWGPVPFAGDGNAFDVPSACAVDAAGNLVVAGTSNNRIEVLEYDAQSGAALWGPAAFPGPAGGSRTRPTSLLLDATGNILLAGQYQNPDQTLSLAVLKLAGATGAPLWSSLTPADLVDEPPAALALFGNGDVAIRTSVSSGSDRRLQDWRLRGSDGSPEWGPIDLGVTVLDFFMYSPVFVASNGRVFGAAVFASGGSSAFELDGQTGALAWGPTPFTIPAGAVAWFEDLTMGADGNVVATGNDFDTIWTLKYQGTTGDILWGPIVFSEPPGPVSAWQVLTDAASNVILFGYGLGSPFFVKYSGADGSVVWGPTILPLDGISGFALDAGGNPVALGYKYDANVYYLHTAVVKVSGTTGAILWGPSVVASAADQNDYPEALAISSSGDVFAVGYSSDFIYGSVWFALKLAGADGALQWGPVGSPGLLNTAYAAVSLGGDLVAGGWATGGMGTVKYSGADGSVLWGPLLVPGGLYSSVAALAVDGAGNVIAAGAVENDVTSSDFATIKYRGSDGAVLWGPVLFDGEAHSADYVYPLGLGLDASGNPVVGGTSRTSSRGEDITVLKYDGTTGATLWGPVYSGGPGNEQLYGFGLNGNAFATGAQVDGAFFLEAWNESFGIQSLQSDLEPAFCGQAYSFPFTAANGSSPYSWTVVSGALPPGLFLSSTGILSGTPTEEGSFAFTVRATDAGSATSDRAFTLLVTEGAEFFGIDASVGASCQVTLSVSGAWTSYAWLPGGETTPTIQVSPAETTTYGVVVGNGAGCLHRFSRTVPATALQDPGCLAPAIASISPASGPASGGTAVTISGVHFAPGASVAMGDAAASGATVNDPTRITASSPALAAGRLYDVVVVNPDTGNTALLRAWLADFVDVAEGAPFHAAIETIVRAGVTAGCGGGNYCPSAPATRAQMAVFLLKSKFGSTYAPPPAAGIFLDVPPSDPFAPWIEQLANMGVTAGCGGGNYCPSSPVTRAQMAVFLLKTRNGALYTPPRATGIFGDVPVSDPFAPWIEEIYLEEITGGCSASPVLYCPGSPTTRGQMAVFLSKTFGL